MAGLVESVLHRPAGYRSVSVARHVMQLDEHTATLLQTLRDLTPQTLEWQLRPGVNTIGMLVAHIARTEAHLTAVVLEGKPDSDLPAVIGISAGDDGVPLAPEGRPPAALSGKPASFFETLLTRARENTRRVARGLTDADLERRVTRPRPGGGTRVFSPEWALYHMLEHQAGHLGQIQMLRHLAR